MARPNQNLFPSNTVFFAVRAAVELTLTSSIPFYARPELVCRNVMCIPRLAAKRVWIGCSSSHTNI
jgi:hypothetical protein